jgi:hypothetical protein
MQAGSSLVEEPAVIVTAQSGLLDHSVRQVGAGKFLRHLGAVALGDAGHERLFGGEIAIEVARAHARLDADLLHRRPMEARAHEAALGRGKDLGLTIGSKLNVGPSHAKPPGIAVRYKRMNARSPIRERSACQESRRPE